jgi:hypothetical protein
MASENLTVTLLSQSTPDDCCLSAGNGSYHNATTLYHPKKHAPEGSQEEGGQQGSQA